jgi:hypothetical protein
MEKLKISLGNKKLGNDTLIINITSATDCKSCSLGLCKIGKKRCYAMKAERMYKQVLPFRRAQEKQWDTLTAYEIAQAIKDIMSRKRTPIKYLRFSEAGDFRHVGDVLKLYHIARLLPGLIVYGYTARRDLFNRDLNPPKNLVVNGSGFMVDNSFTAVYAVSSQGASAECAGNCRTCSLCKTKGNRAIVARYH